ncbi:MAG: hypothetical protein AAF413_02585 [Patescibacteria group bacterium]
MKASENRLFDVEPLTVAKPETDPSDAVDAEGFPVHPDYPTKEVQVACNVGQDILGILMRGGDITDLDPKFLIDTGYTQIYAATRGETPPLLDALRSRQGQTPLLDIATLEARYTDDKALKTKHVVKGQYAGSPPRRSTTDTSPQKAKSATGSLQDELRAEREADRAGTQTWWS